jgi:hypothetical protein
VAQVMKMAREHGPGGYRAGLPEQPYYEVKPEPPLRRRVVRLGFAGAAGAAVLAGVAPGIRQLIR